MTVDDCKTTRNPASIAALSPYALRSLGDRLLDQFVEAHRAGDVELCEQLFAAGLRGLEESSRRSSKNCASDDELRRLFYGAPTVPI